MTKDEIQTAITKIRLGSKIEPESEGCIDIFLKLDDRRLASIRYDSYDWRIPSSRSWKVSMIGISGEFEVYPKWTKYEQILLDALEQALRL